MIFLTTDHSDLTDHFLLTIRYDKTVPVPTVPLIVDEIGKIADKLEGRSYNFTDI